MKETGNIDILQLLRENIKKVVPYSSARDEYTGDKGIFLDANENAFGSATDTEHNRYPDPWQRKVKEEIKNIKNIDTGNIFLGNGSDEGIDLLIRAFCNPGTDNIIYLPPTYGMYKISAQINDVEQRPIYLNSEYQPDVSSILNAIDNNTKIIFLCSPNNPSGNLIKSDKIKTIIENFNGLVVIDEAYIDFSPKDSFMPYLANYTNLVILQTLSKAWGLANIRLGMLFGCNELVNILNKIKPPYNINGLTQDAVLEGLKNYERKEEYVNKILEEKEWLKEKLTSLNIVEKVYPSDANFFLVKIKNAFQVYEYLAQNLVIVRDRSNVPKCENCLRITVGTHKENETLINLLKSYNNA